MVLYEGVVAKGDNGNYLTRFGHWDVLQSAALFDRCRLEAAVASMRDPGPFSGSLQLIPAFKEDTGAPQLTSGQSIIASLRFPPRPPAGSRVTYDNGSMVAALLRSEEPPAADASQQKPMSF